MKIHEVQQGTDAWLELRRAHFCASDAPAALGVSPYVPRARLIERLATGIEPEVSEEKRELFARGHAAEAAMRPIIEGMRGERLTPCVVTDEIEGLNLLASLDGLSEDGLTIWEHKLWSQSWVDALRAGEVPIHWRAQIEHQLLVSSAVECVLTMSDGTPDAVVSVSVQSDPELRARLIAAWKQVQDDVHAYRPSKPAPVAAPVTDALPALVVQVRGEVVASNLAEFRERALSLIRGVSRELITDQDFAAALERARWCERVEERCDVTRRAVLAQMASVDEVIQALNAVAEEARKLRLDLQRKIKTEREHRLASIVEEAIRATERQIEQAQHDLAPEYRVRLDAQSRAAFGAALKGLRTLASMQDALNRVRLEVWTRYLSDIERRRSVLYVLDEYERDYGHLLADRRELVERYDATSIRALIESRVRDEMTRREALQREAEERARREAEERARREADRAVAAATSDAVSDAVAERSPVTLSLEELREIVAPLEPTIAQLRALGCASMGDRRGFRLLPEGIRAFARALIDRGRKLEEMTQ